MSKPFRKPKASHKSYSSIAIGFAFTLFLFLAIPLTQIFTNYEKNAQPLDILEIAPDPPPPYIEEQANQPVEKKILPEFDTPAPPISLDQINIALEPGTGNSLSGDFALPRFDVQNTDLGMHIFDIYDLDKIPNFRRQPNVIYPAKALRQGLSGYVVIRFIVDELGNVDSIEVVEASDPIFVTSVKSAYLRAKFNPGEKNGHSVKFKMQQKITF
jgi:protein TonB